MFRGESIDDHMGCTCERVVEVGTAVITGSTLEVALLVTEKKPIPLTFLTMDFTV
jgi:hypothetical protein